MSEDQYFQEREPEKQSFVQHDITNTPPPLYKQTRRPYKGIFLTYFLLFTGLLFFFHGFHRYEEYTIYDLVSVWVLALLLLIPGVYFSCIIFAIEMKISGFFYKDHPELFA